MKPVEKMFSEKGSWFKGNLHSHTVNSDGRLTPAQSAAYYREHGYSFICFSEHDYYTDPVSYTHLTLPTICSV